MSRYILITGNPTPNDGLFYIGPFPTPTAVLDYAEESGREKDWWVGELLDPHKSAEDEVVDSVLKANPEAEDAL